MAKDLVTQMKINRSRYKRGLNELFAGLYRESRFDISCRGRTVVDGYFKPLNEEEKMKLKEYTNGRR